MSPRSTSMPARTTRLDAAFVATALGGRLRARSGPDRELTGAAIDSRELQPGDLFVALPGEHSDGHDFALAALDRGAGGLLLSREVPGVEAQAAALGAACFHVDDPLAALQELGAAWRRALSHIEVVGITGNVGKTTTRAFVAALLARRFRVQATAGSFNNEIGVPLTLVRLRPDTERAVIEMGMYTTGEIAQLARWAQPRVGVVLNVGPVHLERAGSLQAIVEAKRELVEALPADGHALLNVDDAAVAGMADHTAARVWRFGTTEAADVRGTEVESHGTEGFAFTLSFAGASRRVRMSVPGTHLLSNALATAAVGFVAGMTIEDVAEALEALSETPRLRIATLPNGATLLDDTYNANPASMEAALALLGEMPGRHIALLGDMRELGELALVSHQRIGERAAAVVDLLFTVGDLAEALVEAARAAGLERSQHLESRELAIEMLGATLKPGDTLLIKGSRALALDEVARALEAAPVVPPREHSA